MPRVGIPEKESGLMPKRHLEGATPEARAKARQRLGTLKQLTVQPVTRIRYDQVLQDFFRYLKEIGQILPTTAHDLDLVMADYIEHLWATGAGRSTGSNVLAALQDAQPHSKGKLPQSWRLMKTWVINEIPNRAPPLPLEILEAMVGYSLFKQQHLFALSLLVGFFGLLRTGEILTICASHVSVVSNKGPAVISLGLTKSGKRQGAAESVTIYVEDVCRRLFQWKAQVRSTAKLTGAAHIWRKQFSDTLTALKFHHLDFRPYSLRRGGSTHLFRQQGSLDRLMVVGRWQAAKTARLYVNEGLAVLAELSLVWNPFSRNLRNQYLRSLTSPLPKLEPTPKRVQGRGTWKAKKKQRNRGPKKGAHRVL